MPEGKPSPRVFPGYNLLFAGTMNDDAGYWLSCLIHDLSAHMIGQFDRQVLPGGGGVADAYRFAIRLVAVIAGGNRQRVLTWRQLRK